MNSKLHIQNQTRLRWSQQAELLFDGMRHRFFRTLLTWTVVALAVAFVCYVISEQKMVTAVEAQTNASLERFTSLQRFCAWIDSPIDARTLQNRIAQTPVGSWELDAVKGLLNIEGENSQTFLSNARIWTKSQNWFEAMSLADRRVIFNQTQWPDIIPLLGDKAALPGIQAAAYQTAARIPQGLLQAASQRDAYTAQRATHVLTLEKKQLKAKAAMQDQTLLQWLAKNERTDAQVQQLFESLGIQLPQVRREQIAHEAREYQSVLDWSLKQAAEQISDKPGLSPAPVVTPPTTANIAAERIFKEQSNADVMRRKIIQHYPGRDEFDRTSWLVGTAFLVCLAGISNAMLVSVLERFREIATMKCLGAMDGFIAMIFLAEASIIGLIGGLAGGIVGVLAALLRTSSILGSSTWTALDVQTLATIVLVGIVGGWLLAMLSSAYPAIAAARMPPMAAMRLE